jgi:MFS family permease
MRSWTPLAALAIAQFVMVLDQAVMNVSISQLVDDFDTTVTTIQGVITLYSLVMAMFMLAGGKIGDIIGRRRAFVVGLVVYGIGSGLTAVAPNVLVLTLGWSVLEGLGAALVLPALAALIAGNFEGRERITAYAIIGGVAGAGIAVGPILGGWATTELSWRIVFAGEVVLVLVILALSRRVLDALRDGPAPRLDIVGTVLSASALGAIVLGVLQAGSWGLIQPTEASPITPLGFSLAIWMIGLGAGLAYAFVRWQRHREARGEDPLLHLDLLAIPPLRSGLTSLLSQNLILMGVFFVVPLYLQLVLGLDALETGIKMLPVSVTMFVTSAIGARLTQRYAVRTIIRAGLLVAGVASLLMIAGIDPQLEGWAFFASMALLGVGMGLLASQLGNVVQSSVDASGRSEAGGLQYTSQQLGSSLGVALIGAIVIAGLASTFVANLEADPRITDEVAQQVGVAVDGNVEFVSSEQVAAAAEAAGLDPASASAIVEDYEDAQLQSLRTGLLVAAGVALLALMFTGGLPARRPGESQETVELVAAAAPGG